jgi:hypothetical protein
MSILSQVRDGFKALSAPVEDAPLTFRCVCPGSDNRCYRSATFALTMSDDGLFEFWARCAFNPAVDHKLVLDELGNEVPV